MIFHKKEKLIKEVMLEIKNFRKTILYDLLKLNIA